ncbi:helix-turn-helix domain-containing protein [Acinetobacter baumannii]|uniref:helix-turn-helix domain-containing protein n=1 Tax=Acinetobacter calcoaceticus/baumannii complex TaxID=909768 RepID=UPI001B323D29|nr:MULTISPECIES: AraC family transcriptional regulator [Acinetobacter calcoaceticus/baumannii complex]MBP4064384.1 helix-turn-helix transcriptional regulator [Acinetobacter baumannii]MDO7509620.1 AraC family transcriptional regulator [Acinetobacter baumannii]MDO7534198.1 AraC family transcriptional regulator [Acinetobacter pittii]MDV7463942.1 AraC family transcriptional regulator [Acinetobacter baumannii]MDV7477585.1 AraC family transcriptional regulator [Acinetobacter baumannii]
MNTYLSESNLSNYNRIENIFINYNAFDCSKSKKNFGIFIYCYSKKSNVCIGSTLIQAPPSYGVWIPTKYLNERITINSQEYCVIRMPNEFTNTLPLVVSTVICNSITDSILRHCKEKSISSIQSEKDKHLYQVLLDQITDSEYSNSFLPLTNHPKLAAILQYIRDHSSQNINISALAKQFEVNERTLSRQCNYELGMSLIEWKQRLKILNTISLLDENSSIDSIAKNLGYSTTSGFITMFKQWTGLTPNKYKKEILSRFN